MSDRDPSSLPPVLLRENPDPEEGRGPLPALLLVLLGAMAAWGFFYVKTDARDLGVGGDRRSEQAPPPAGADGEAIYQTRCASCHQATGAGVAGTFPPLASSPWVKGDGETTARIVLFGVQGPMRVGAATYQGQMPRFADTLKDDELAAVVSYVRASWGNAGSPVDAATVAKLRAASRASPWSEAELLELRKHP